MQLNQAHADVYKIYLVDISETWQIPDQKPWKKRPLSGEQALQGRVGEDSCCSLPAGYTKPTISPCAPPVFRCVVHALAHGSTLPLMCDRCHSPRHHLYRTTTENIFQQCSFAPVIKVFSTAIHRYQLNTFYFPVLKLLRLAANHSQCCSEIKSVRATLQTYLQPRVH